MKAESLRAGAELCRHLLETAERKDVRQALTALVREYEEAAAAVDFQRRACSPLSHRSGD
jgi:hypothetical protein